MQRHPAAESETGPVVPLAYFAGPSLLMHNVQIVQVQMLGTSMLIVRKYIIFPPEHDL